jgi:cell division septation protein DedD
MMRSVIRVIAGAIAVAGAAGAPERSAAQQAAPAASTATSARAESPPPPSSIELTAAPGVEKAVQCGACHSLDYIRMNSHFLDLAGWRAVVTKMIKAYGAPIPAEDTETIVSYLAENYGRSAAPP